MSKVTKDQYIKDLEHDVDTLGSMFTELREENTKLKKVMKELVVRVPSGYLTSGDAKFSGETHPDAKHKVWDEISLKEERTDEWRIEQFNRNRAQGDQISKIEEMKYGNNEPLQLNLFED